MTCENLHALLFVRPKSRISKADNKSIVSSVRYVDFYDCKKELEFTYKKVLENYIKGISDCKCFLCPCGKCGYCNSIKISNISSRMEMTMNLLTAKDGYTIKKYPYTYFILLTYNEECCPRTDKGHMTLCRADFQLFMKRYREKTGASCKCFYCGEYGGKKGRPHHHVCLLTDVPFKLNDVGYASSRGNATYYCYELEKKIWKQGKCFVGLEVNNNTCKYITKYITKQQKKQYPDDVVPEYHCYSKGLGKEYFIIHYKEIFDISNELVYQNRMQFFNGKKILIPKYFWYLLKKYDLELYETLKEQIFLRSMVDYLYKGKGINLFTNYKEGKKNNVYQDTHQHDDDWEKYYDGDDILEELKFKNYQKKKLTIKI